MRALAVRRYLNQVCETHRTRDNYDLFFIFYLFIFIFLTVIAPVLNVPELSFQLTICPPREDLSIDTGYESLAPTAAELRAPVAQH